MPDEFWTRAALGQAEAKGPARLGLRAAVLAGLRRRTLRCSEGDVPGHRRRRVRLRNGARRHGGRCGGAGARRAGPRVPLLQGARRLRPRGRRRGPGARARGFRGSHPIAERRALRPRVRDARGAAPRRPRGRDVISQGHDALARPLGFDGQRPRPGARAPGEPRGVLRARPHLRNPRVRAADVRVGAVLPLRKMLRRRVVPAGVRAPARRLAHGARGHPRRRARRRELPGRRLRRGPRGY